MNGTKLRAATGLYALLLTPFAFAQPAERPEVRSLERTDLSGHWRVPLRSGRKGSVVFSRREALPARDSYSVRFDLPSGAPRVLMGTFDGTRLTLVEAGGSPASSAPLLGAVNATPRRGISGILEGEGVVGPPSETHALTASAEQSAGGVQAKTRWTYVLSRRKLRRGLFKRSIPMLVFTAQERSGSLPVAKFGRANIRVSIARTDGAGALLDPGASAEFKLLVQPESPGDVTWSSSSALTLEARGHEVRVSGRSSGEATLEATFVSKAGSRHKAKIVLTFRPEIETVKVVAITFTSDHGVLKDNTATWANSGDTFPEPEWTPAAQHPITHTMGETVRMTVELDVGPANAAPKRGVLHATSPGGLELEQEVNLKPGSVTVTIDSGRTKLARRIQKLDLALSWSLVGVGSLSELNTTHTPTYVTLSTPTTPARNPGVTLKRMRKAIEAVGSASSLDPPTIVEKVIRRWSRYNLQVAYRNAWELGEDRKDPTTGELIGADCQTIVRFTQNVIGLVGCPGEAEYVVVWARVEAPERGVESLNARNHMTRPAQGYNSHNAFDRTRRRWIAALVDGGGGLNNYEAALRFTHRGKRYYPGGVNAVFKNPDQVIKVFTTMSWVDLDDLNSGAKEHIHRYR